jgi:hypothetical protein
MSCSVQSLVLPGMDLKDKILLVIKTVFNRNLFNLDACVVHCFMIMYFYVKLYRKMVE